MEEGFMGKMEETSGKKKEMSMRATHHRWAKGKRKTQRVASPRRRAGKSRRPLRMRVIRPRRWAAAGGMSRIEVA
jgi:hypothetical protein